MAAFGAGQPMGSGRPAPRWEAEMAATWDNAVTGKGVHVLIGTLLTTWLFLRLFRSRSVLGSNVAATAGCMKDASAHAELAEKRDYSLHELASYDGTVSGRPILMAISGRVFDVSSNSEYYKQGGRYHGLAGRDASRLLAQGVLEPESARAAARPLAAVELHELQTWLHHFEDTYEVVGNVREEKVPDDDTEWRNVDVSWHQALQISVTDFVASIGAMRWLRCLPSQRIHPRAS